MKKLALLSLALVACGAFAQANPAGEPDAAGPSPADMARVVGRTMGVLPVVQKACGHADKEQKALKDGLDKLEERLTGQADPSVRDGYRAGAKQGVTLMTNELARMDKAQLSGLCKEFNDKYPEMMTKLKEANAATSKR